MVISVETQNEFHIHCACADSKQVKSFLEKHPIDVNYKNGMPLILAIRSIQKYPAPSAENRLETMKTLVEAGADIHIHDDAPMYWALKLKNHVAVDYLFSQQGNFSIDPEIIDDYLSEGKNLNQQTVERLTDIKKNSTMRLAL
ncbi:ankyrin repeat domain-containing protein [Legionella londiniensis]|uniref:Ankyrin repeats (3 copies) n=1 Tax=Legionella londiniensis TaxID=45068 RepID=A0A0W0VP21_9GAMM|nr:ankyrin repeat domain-containing protein [Legionella londiniensis]KTD21847.1 Ankyrin repeats (3 copies) [Legionella londiniensis]STX92670.1 Ankyrin repeats (3 copies) [Legionella londiniensis]